MSAAEKIKPEDKFVSVDGLKLRYIEEGSGPSVLFLHGASLGSSADVFLRNLGPFAKAGFRAVAFDYPGFGLSDIPAKQSTAQQRNSIPKFIDAAGLGKTALIAHSRSGGFAIQLALEDPSRYSHVDHSWHRLAAAAADRSAGRQVRSGTGAGRQGDGAKGTDAGGCPQTPAGGHLQPCVDLG